MTQTTYTADVLVVGGGTGGTAAAIQSARQGAKTILVSEFAWLGGMLTSAGVSAPDGNELVAFQTGLWGRYLQELRQRQPGGLNNSWVSFFSYDPRMGAKIFADWVQELSNLHWISGQVPKEVLQQGNCITGVRFADFTVTAKIVLDGTELGDLLALAEIPHRWGWELQSAWGEKSAPVCLNHLTEKYPVQAPTWVVVMQDFGEAIAPEIPRGLNYDPALFAGAWDNYGAEKFLNYGRLPGGRFMINWPICGNDYGEGVGRLVESEVAKQEFLQECRWHSQNFAHFIQNNLGRRFGLAESVFPSHSTALALHPYYRESRRLVGLTTVTEQDILPMGCGRVASLFPDTIAIGNYANDHHYPQFHLSLQPKSIRWGGRWTGTPFTIPYRCLVPLETDGLLVCEKNISVSHIANGSTRLQPVVMNIGQAAGTAAAMCVDLKCQPRDLPVRQLQTYLLQDLHAPACVVPLFNLDISPQNPQWRNWQLYYLNHFQAYPLSGNYPWESSNRYDHQVFQPVVSSHSQCFTGVFQRLNQEDYHFTIIAPAAYHGQTWQIVTLRSHIQEQLQAAVHEQLLTIWGHFNHAGGWLLAESLDISSK
jgi:hypothetical protein